MQNPNVLVIYTLSDLPEVWRDAVSFANKYAYDVTCTAKNGTVEIKRIDPGIANQCFEQLGIDFRVTHAIDCAVFERLVISSYLHRMSVPCDTFLPLFELTNDQLIAYYLPEITTQREAYCYQKEFFDTMSTRLRKDILSKEDLNLALSDFLSHVNRFITKFSVCKEGPELINGILSVGAYVSKVLNDIDAEALRIINGTMTQIKDLPVELAKYGYANAKDNSQKIVADVFDRISEKIQHELNFLELFIEVMVGAVKMEDNGEHANFSTSQPCCRHTLKLPNISIPNAYYEALSGIR